MTATIRLRIRRIVTGVVAGLGLASTLSAPAFADPPGPTDYQSQVQSVAPETSTIEVGIIGGDSFLELRVEPGTEAIVIGYEGEDYLWFRPDGVVLENQNSPATHLNVNRYGNDGVPVLGGLGLGVSLWFQRARGIHPIAAVVPLAVLAVVVGVAQYLSLPAATGPRPIWIVLPIIAVASAAAGVVLAKRGMHFAADAALFLVGVELVVWGHLKRDGLSAAIIPTDAPFWLDRFTTAFALAGGVAIAAVALWRLFAVPAPRPELDALSDSKELSGSPHPAHR